MSSKTSKPEKPSAFNLFQERFRIGPHFLKDYLEYWNRSQPATPLGHPNDLEKLTDEHRKWAEHALLTNVEGLNVWKEYKKVIAESKPLRALVLSTEFGGIVSALYAEGIEAWGIVDDPQFAIFARANGRDRGFENQIIEGNSAGPIPAHIGKFDLILARSAIELSNDPERLMSDWVGRLNPGGTLILEIPNKYSLELVAADRHYGLFGLMLLDSDDGALYHQSLQKSGGYRLGRYRTLAQYQDMAEQSGCSTKRLPGLFSPIREIEECGDLVENALSAMQQFHREVAGKVPITIQIKINVLFRKYLGSLNRDLVEVAQGSYSRDEFKLKYLTNFLTMIANKPLEETVHSREP